MSSRPESKLELALSGTLQGLRDHPEGLRKKELAARCHASEQTIARALKVLRDEYGAPIEEDRGTWRLTGEFWLPMADPRPEDLTAVILASAVLRPFADEQLSNCLEALIMELDSRLRDRGRKNLASPRGVTATMSSSVPMDRHALEVLMNATRGHVVRFEHRAVWTGTKSQTVLEPWQVRLHDGVAYVRGFSRTRGEPRTYRLADLRSVSRIPNAKAEALRPPPDQIFGPGDPASSVDEDRPGHARIHARGAIARLIHPIMWHPDQSDEWLKDYELLERRVPYNSCREFARRLLSVIDGLELVEAD